MLVDSKQINALYNELLVGHDIEHPPETDKGNGYMSLENHWMVPLTYFRRYGMTMLREAFEDLGPKDRIQGVRLSGTGVQVVRLFCHRWNELREGPVLPGPRKHDLYKTGDLGVPHVIQDSNGAVVLGLCKVCGQGEGTLDSTCPGDPR